MRSAQRGRTVLELIVAMTLSTVVLIGVAHYYGTSAQGARSSHQVGTLHEEAPLAMFVIGQAIKRAGYGEIVGTGFAGTNQTLFDGAHLRACRGGRFADATAGNFDCVADPGGNDALLVRFQADSVVAPTQFGTRNCLGAAAVATPITTPGHVAAGTAVPIVENAYRVVDGRLECQGNRGAPDTLARDVVEFRVFFGFDEEGAALALAGGASASPRGSTLVDADTIRARDAAFSGTRSAWDFVVSAHLCLVMRTSEAGTSVAEGGFGYRGCPTTPAELMAGTGPQRVAADRAIHRTFHQVFTVRARATASPSVRL